MSVLARAIRFVAKHAAESLTVGFVHQVADHVGDAVGMIIGRKIDPEHRKDLVEDDDEDDKGPPE